MKSESGNWKFWGPKPVPFQLDNESFYLGSDVANYLKLFRGKLYSAFPKLKTKKTQPGQNREIYVSHVNTQCNVGDKIIFVINILVTTYLVTNICLGTN